MTPIAIVVFIISATLLWGGLVWSVVRLRKYPDRADDDSTLVE